MESTWGLAIFMWVALIIGVGILLIYELRKTPEQKKNESECVCKKYKEQQLSRKIIEVRPLGVSGTKFKRGGLGGALFGSFIGGVPGAIVGAMLPWGRGVPVENFWVKYGNGKVVIRECMQGSSEYKALMKHVS